MKTRFVDCDLDVDAHELTRAGERVPLEPQVFDVLAYLVAHRDRVVPKTELLDEVWGDRFVSESALTSRIKSARRAVGDNGRDQRVIRTIHGRGFRFVAEVERNERNQHNEPSEQNERNNGSDRVGARQAAAPDGVGAGEPVDADQLVGAVVERLEGGWGAAYELVGAASSRLGQVIDDVYETSAQAGYLVGRGSGAGAGLRPYGCVLDAIDEIAQRAPELLDELPVGCRTELDRVLGGAPPTQRSRLFLGVRELLVAAAASRPTVIAIDELQYADPDSLELLAQVARVADRRPLVVVAAHSAKPRLGTRYRLIEMSADDNPDVLPQLPPDLEAVLTTLALEGPTVDLIAFRAACASARVAPDHLLDVAIISELLQPLPGGDGFRFTPAGLAGDLAADLAPHRRAQLHAAMADGLDEAGADPARVAHHLLHAHETRQALPYVVQAARAASHEHRYADVLRWTGAGLDVADADERGELLALRAWALASIGDPTAVQRYREALRHAKPGVTTDLRAQLARAAMQSWDLETAREAIAGIDVADRDEPPVLLVRASLAYYDGDLDTADALLDRARAAGPLDGLSDRVLDVISLQGLIAHNRGEWFDRLRRELRTTQDSPELAATLFDGHLCVAEYLLYGPTPYAEVIALAAGLRRNAEQSGARRAVAFAVCVAGEARLLAGELDLARRDLEEAVHLHRELGADAGTAHSLQRLAELELAVGNPLIATRLLREAIVLGRWSPIAKHLLQRAYGTLIRAAPDAIAALAVVDEAETAVDGPTTCQICQVMVEVPAAIACAEGGRLDDARKHLARARWSAAHWEGTAWKAAVLEAEAALVVAEGNPADATARLTEAMGLFEQAGQPLDAARCREACEDLSLGA